MTWRVSSGRPWGKIVKLEEEKEFLKQLNDTLLMNTKGYADQAKSAEATSSTLLKVGAGVPGVHKGCIRSVSGVY
jgi:hypothetical protein